MPLLTEEQISQIREEIVQRLHMYLPSWSGGDPRSRCAYSSDYMCAFCYNRPREYSDDIVHDNNCPGQEILNILDNAK